MSQDPFYRDPKLYDAVFGTMAGDLDFFVQRAAASHGPALEIACGTGRITIPIAQHGVEVTGLDISKAMLDEARNKAQQSGLNIEWIEADCRRFVAPKKFALIFIGFNSLLHLHDRVSMERFLSCVCEHLLPEGKFMFDIFSPSIEFLVEHSGHRRETQRLTDPYSGLPALVEEMVEYDAASQVNKSTLFFSVGDKRDVRVHDLRLRCYFPQEIDALLHYNGFEVVEKLGDYDGTPFSSKSMKQIATCRLRRD